MDTFIVAEHGVSLSVAQGTARIRKITIPCSGSLFRADLLFWFSHMEFCSFPYTLEFRGTATVLWSHRLFALDLVQGAHDARN